MGTRTRFTRVKTIETEYADPNGSECNMTWLRATQILMQLRTRYVSDGAQNATETIKDSLDISSSAQLPEEQA
jgi:hypothetical protein